jgi:hypothetical protein
MPNWKKVITSGSAAELSSLYAPSITGSLLGTASYAITASYITASGVYGPYGSNSVISSSYSETSSLSERTFQTDILVLNQTGFNIAKGTVIRITGSNNSSDIPRIITASYENDNNSANTLGITTQTIADGAEGYVITEGILTGINTQAFTSGQLIYLGATGSIIGYAPVAPLHAVRLGEVIRHQSNNGSIYVRIDNGYELNELHDVLITSASSGDLLVRSGSVWINNKQLTGSYGLTGSLNATSFTGSLFGTSSWASNATTAQTASYVLNAVSASFATLAQTANTASYVVTAQTASYVLNAVSASFAATASYVNPLSQNVIITGSTNITNTGGGIPSLSIQSSGTNINPYIQIVSDSTVSTTQLVAARGSGTGGVSVTGVNRAYLNLSNAAGYHNVISSNDGLAFSAYTHTGYDPVNDQMRLKNGNLGIGTGYSATARLDVQAPGTSSSDIAFRVVNSGSATNIFSILGNRTLIHSGSVLITGSLTVTEGITGSLQGTATTASYVLNAVSASFASTASYVNTLNQNVLITGSATIGAASLGASENTLTLGARDAGSEGGQLGLNAPGGTYTSASMLDNYANFFRILRGSNAGSDALVAQWNMHNKQMQLPAYNSPTAFTGTTLVGLLGFDNSGNLITTTTSSGGGGGGVTITNNVDNYVITATGTANTLNGESGLQYNGSSLSITGQITSSGAIISNANGAMYFRGGDDAEFWDINVANTVGIYGQQTQGIGAVKLGSGGPTLYGSGSRLGIGTTGPVATVDINGNLYVASGITGSLQGTATTASYVLNAVSSSFATTASYATQALSASWAPAGNPFPYTGSADITGSLTLIGPLNVQTYDGANYVTAIEVNDNKRNINDVLGVSSVNANSRILYDSLSTESINWDTRTLKDATGNVSSEWGLRRLTDTSTSRSIDWESRVLQDSTNLPTVDWNSRWVADSLGNLSIDWNNRYLIDSSNTTTANWDAFALRYKIETYTYLKRFIDTANQDLFSDVPALGQFNFEGEVIEATLDGTAAQFDLIYLETDGIWYPVTQGTQNCTKLLGICAATGAHPLVILEGSITVNDGTYNDTPKVTSIDHGLPIYIKDSTGNTMSTTVPTTTGDYVRILGHAYYQNSTNTNYWTMKFRPSNDWYVI